MDANDSNSPGNPPRTWAGETLNLELKSWLDPTRDEHKAAIVRALLALRNRNGGQLIVGVRDDGQARTDRPPFDLRQRYSSDAIQALVSKYASTPFAVTVAFETVVGADIVVLSVPTGVTSPVAVRAGIVAEGTELLRFGEVPFRTLLANGRVSSAACQPADWPELFEICFNNREADIGRFIRRHLSGPGDPLEAITRAFERLAQDQRESPSEVSLSFLNAGHARFKDVVDSRRSLSEKIWPENWGGREVALIVEPGLLGQVATREFIRKVQASVPRLTSYPPWMDTKGVVEGSDPYVHERRWEAVLDERVETHGLFDSLTFQILDPTGRFYERRLLLSDVIARRNGDLPAVHFDPQAAIVDVTETLETGLSICRGLGVGDGEHTLRFAFKWTGLKGRRIGSRLLLLRSDFEAHEEDERPVTVELRGDTPASALVPYVKSILGPVFANFAGYSEPDAEFDRIAQSVVDRRSGY